MTKPKVLVVDSHTENHFERPEVEARILHGVADVELVKVASERDTPPAALAGADAVILWHCLPFDAGVIDHLTRCKAVVKAAVGYDNIDVEHAGRKGIAVFNTPDYGTEEIADHAMSLILALARRLVKADQHIRSGAWDWAVVKPTFRLRGKTLGILGFGRIGRALAARAQPFGLQVTFYDPYVPSGLDKAHGVKRSEDLQEFLGQADIISIHASLTDSARGLLGPAEFLRMKDRAVLINTARGAIVDNTALLDALRSGRLSMAGLDVVDNEPAIPAELRAMDQVLLTPHSAFYSEEGLLELRCKSAELVRDILLRKKVRNRVAASTETLFQLTT